MGAVLTSPRSVFATPGRIDGFHFTDEELFNETYLGVIATSNSLKEWREYFPHEVNASALAIVLWNERFNSDDRRMRLIQGLFDRAAQRPEEWKADAFSIHEVVSQFLDCAIRWRREMIAEESWKELVSAWGEHLIEDS